MHNFLKPTFLRKVKSCFLVVLSWPFYLFSLLVPRCKNIWVFGAWSGKRYADNSRHVYEYVRANKKEIRAIWLSRNRDLVESLRKSGHEIYLVSSFLGFWFSCRALIVIASNGKMDVNRPAISRAIKVQLWHGIPLKNIRRTDLMIPDCRDGWVGKMKVLFYCSIIKVKKSVFPFVLDSWDFVISTSPLISERMALAYGISSSQVVVTGYPRNDILLDARRRVYNHVDEMLVAQKPKKLVLYAPTFRNRYEDNVALFKGWDVRQFELCLKKHDTLFMIKLHPIFNGGALTVGLPSSSCVYQVQEEDVLELNELLPHVDILITDYSGAYLDYLLLDRPIIFTPFDLEQYKLLDRELYEDYDEATPGVKCHNWPEVLSHLDCILSGCDDYRESRKRAMQKYHTYCDSLSSSRVYHFVKTLLKE